VMGYVLLGVITFCAVPRRRRVCDLGVERLEKPLTHDMC
jgi:hypothetical protein